MAVRNSKISKFSEISKIRQCGIRTVKINLIMWCMFFTWIECSNFQILFVNCDDLKNDPWAWAKCSKTRILSYMYYMNVLNRFTGPLRILVFRIYIFIYLNIYAFSGLSTRIINFKIRSRDRVRTDSNHRFLYVWPTAKG